MDHQYIAFKFLDSKDDTAAEATFSGLGSVFGNEDLGGDVVKRGAFKDSLKSRWPKMLLHHGFGETGMTPVGKFDSVKETPEGLAVSGKLFLETDSMRLVYRAMKEGQMDGLSIGYIPKVWEWDDKKGIRYLKEVELHEISLVTFPMNEAARVQAVKSRLKAGELVTKRDLEAILRDAGISREDAKALVASGHGGLTQRDADDAAVVTALDNLRRRL